MKYWNYIFNKYMKLELCTLRYLHNNKGEAKETTFVGLPPKWIKFVAYNPALKGTVMDACQMEEKMFQKESCKGKEKGGTMEMLLHG